MKHVPICEVDESLIPQEARDRMSGGGGQGKAEYKRSNIVCHGRTETLSSCLVSAIFVKGVVVSPRPKWILIQGYSVSNLPVKMQCACENEMIL